MKHLLLFTFAVLLSFSAKSQDNYLHPYKWKNRVVLLFAQEPQDTDFAAQLQLLNQDQEALEERDIVILSVFPYQVNQNKITKGEKKMAKMLRKQFNGSKGFSIVLIGKDGTIKLKHEHVTQPLEIFSLIDGMPMRQQEMQEDPS